VRAIAPAVFDDDPLRLLRAVRLEDELGFRLDPETEALVREHAGLAARPAGERILDELRRLSADGYDRLAELGLLEPLGGGPSPRLRAYDSPWFRLAATFGEGLKRLPISNELRRFTDTLLRAEPPADSSPRAIHRFRKATEPWALEALAFLEAGEHAGVVRQAREDEPAEPLLRGDELGIDPGPEVGRLLAVVGRGAGGRDDLDERGGAFELVRRSLG